MPVKSKAKPTSQKTSNKRKNTNVKKKNEILLKLEEDLKSKKEKYIRLLAEFDNYKKRKDLEKENLIKYEGYDLFKSFLSILDDIDRTLNIKEIKNNNSIFNGISMIKDKIINLFEAQGINSFESINEDFNPEYHEAIMTKKSKKNSNTIIEEYEQGYKYKDKVLRHAKVIVSK